MGSRNSSNAEWSVRVRQLTLDSLLSIRKRCGIYGDVAEFR
jgi:hypothetical protein